MPTTPLRNCLYRMALPFAAPSPGRRCLSASEGRPLSEVGSFLRIIRRHHVLGSVTLLCGGGEQSLLLTRSGNPPIVPQRDSLFRVASLTKMATALAVLRFAEDGFFSLDAPLSDFFPPARGIPELADITLRQLLSHTSGLADPPSLESSLSLGKPLSEVLPGCRFAPPGSAFRYSNLGFGLLGCVLEQASGLPVSQVFRETLFGPLDMDAELDAAAIPTQRILPIVRILPYHPGKLLLRTPLGERPLSAPDPQRHFGHTAGSLYATADAVRKLLVCLRAHGAPLLKTGLGEEMSRRFASYGPLSPGLSYGLGLLRIENSRLSDSLILGHQGFAYGCADGAFWEVSSDRMLIHLNGGCSEAREGRMGRCNIDLLAWAFRKEMPSWN